MWGILESICKAGMGRQLVWSHSRQRGELLGLTRARLRMRAREAGVDEGALEEAEDGDDPTEAIIDLIVAAERPEPVEIQDFTEESNNPVYDLKKFGEVDGDTALDRFIDKIRPHLGPIGGIPVGLKSHAFLKEIVRKAVLALEWWRSDGGGVVVTAMDALDSPGQKFINNVRVNGKDHPVEEQASEIERLEAQQQQPPAAGDEDDEDEATKAVQEKLELLRGKVKEAEKLRSLKGKLKNPSILIERFVRYLNNLDKNGQLVYDKPSITIPKNLSDLMEKIESAVISPHIEVEAATGVGEGQAELPLSKEFAEIVNDSPLGKRLKPHIARVALAIKEKKKKKKDEKWKWNLDNFLASMFVLRIHEKRLDGLNLFPDVGTQIVEFGIADELHKTMSAPFFENWAHFKPFYSKRNRKAVSIIQTGKTAKFLEKIKTMSRGKKNTLIFLVIILIGLAIAAGVVGEVLTGLAVAMAEAARRVQQSVTRENMIKSDTRPTPESIQKEEERKRREKEEKRAEVRKALGEQELADLDNQLLTAVRQGASVAEIEGLVEKGASPDAKGEGGNPVLFLAAQEGKLNAIETLHKEGANLEATGENGGTALVVALQRKNYGSAQRLLNYNANPNAAGDDGRTALIIVAESPERPAVGIVNKLIESGAELNATDHEGHTALHIAAKYGRQPIARALLDAGADHTLLTNDDGEYKKKTALEIAKASSLGDPFNGHQLIEALLEELQADEEAS